MSIKSKAVREWGKPPPTDTVQLQLCWREADENTGPWSLSHSIWGWPKYGDSLVVMHSELED